MKPNGVNTFGIAIEDAYILGSLLSRYDPAKANTKLRPLLNAFTSIRIDRTESNVETERIQISTLTLDPASDFARERDAILTAASQRSLDDAFAEENAQNIVKVWSFDAREEAEEWWLAWRLPGERSHAASFSEGDSGHNRTGGPGFQVNVSVTVES